MSFKISRRKILAGTAATAIASPFIVQPTRAGTLEAPIGRVVLSISGKIANTNRDGRADFDMAAIEALKPSGFTTTTPWHTMPVRFDGVEMSDLMTHVGAGGETILARALNDYSTEIPIEDFRKHKTLLATKRDGAYMPVTDKGPLFIVYPFDSKPELKHQLFYSRSAWQLNRIVVR